jgi:hypothetical protein
MNALLVSASGYSSYSDNGHFIVRHVYCAKRVVRMAPLAMWLRIDWAILTVQRRANFL